MTCGCGRSPDGCRGWHNLSEEEYQVEYQRFLAEEQGLMTVTEVEHYTDNLFRFRVTKPDNFEFTAGDFTMISIDDAPKRAYSITSSPSDDYLEFYSIKVPDGPLTSKLQNIVVGDTVYVSNQPTGSLILDNLSDGKDLWMLATGTGIAPFISLLRDAATKEKYENLHLVWSVRTADELAAYDEFLKDAGVDYIPVVTQDGTWGGFTQRITDLIRKGILMTDAAPDTDKVMLCGNMDFNVEIRDILKSKNWVQGGRKTPGSFVLERAFVG